MLTGALYSPPDIDAANDAWCASCGPIAAAALLGRPVADVRAAFPWYPERPWCSPTQMLGALDALQIRGVSRRHEPGDRALVDGLAYIQFTGPWTAPGASARWAYQHTHWIAVARGGAAVFDANVDFWIRSSGWTEKVVADLTRDIPRADGGWWVRTTIEVKR